MAKTSPYFQFPIAMMRGKKDVKALVQDIVSYSMWHVGTALYKKTPEQVEVRAEQYHAEYPDIYGYNPQNYDHQIVMAAAKDLRLCVNNASEAAIKAKKKHNEFGINGTQCRIRSDYAWSAHNDNWPCDKLRVLCGVLAGIGDSGGTKLTTTRIRALAAGYSSGSGLAPKTILSQGGVNHWLDALWRGDMFQFCKDGTDRWYSIDKADDKALLRAVKARDARKKSRKKVLNTSDPDCPDDDGTPW